jgi:hypothetical protein
MQWKTIHYMISEVQYGGKNNIKEEKEMNMIDN